MAEQIQRPEIEQTFFGLSLSVPNTIVPLASNIQAPSMIQTIIICNPSTNANSIFFGDQNVSTLTGVEVPAGTSIQVAITQDRQLYEIQDPDVISARVASCQNIPAVAIPVIVWNPSNFWFIAPVAGPTLINLLLFRNVYV